MKVSKKRSIRLRNAPLKGARQIGSNMTEVEHGDLTVLYSYETPVAFLATQGGFVTEKKWSVTTSKHIAKFFDRHGYDRRGAHKISQEDLEAIVSVGGATRDFPINVDPTPAEKRDMFERLTRRRGNRPRRTARRRALIQDMQFFRQHGGGVVGEAARGALDLARAEREMERRNWYVLWEPDQDADLSWMSDKERAEEHEVYCAVLVGPSKHGFSTSDVLASLCGIVDPSREYKRVVEAELASEALSRATR